MNRRNKIIAIVVLLVGLASYLAFRQITTRGRSYPPSATFTHLAQLALFSKNGVSVSISLETDAQGLPLLRATFTPTDQAFHLYGKDLEPKKVRGLGVPTTFELLTSSAVTVAGPVFANVAPLNVEFKELNVTMPLYPDGPVTLRLPVSVAKTGKDISAQVGISYMACKTGGVCLPSVEREKLDLTLPALFPPENL